MAGQDKSFEDLVAEAPAAPTESVVSLVGTLARSSEAGKFVLTLQDGRVVTLETAAVKAHAVLGSSLGRTIVRIQIEAGKIAPIGRAPGFVPGGQAGGAAPFGPVSHLKGSPVVDKPPHNDPAKAVWDASKPARDQAKGSLQDTGTGAAFDVGWGTGYWGDVTIGPGDIW